MKKLILLIALFFIPIVSALECEQEDTCNIVQVCSDSDCGNCTIEIYTPEGNLIDSGVMTETNQTIYEFSTTLNDTGTFPLLIDCDNGQTCISECEVIVEADNIYYLYVIALAFFFVLLGLGYYLEEPVFVIISGFLSCIIAVNLYINGFPGLTNEFLRQMIIIIFVGIGLYLIIAPSIQYFENFEGGMPGGFGK